MNVFKKPVSKKMKCTELHLSKCVFLNLVLEEKNNLHLKKLHDLNFQLLSLKKIVLKSMYES